MIVLATASLLAAVLGAGPQPAPAPCWIGTDRAKLASRLSPLDSVSVTLGRDEVKICYGRPRVRGRTIMGGLLPFDLPWRLGANEATSLALPFAARIGDVAVPPGTYSLYAIPGAHTWHVVVNANARRWGIPIDATVRTHDVGSVTVPVETLDAPVEVLTLQFERGLLDGVTLVVEWERTRVRIPIRRSATSN